MLEDLEPVDLREDNDALEELTKRLRPLLGELLDEHQRSAGFGFKVRTTDSPGMGKSPTRVQYHRSLQDIRTRLAPLYEAGTRQLRANPPSV